MIMTPEQRATIVLTQYRKELHVSIAHPLELGRYIAEAIRAAVEDCAVTAETMPIYTSPKNIATLIRARAKA